MSKSRFTGKHVGVLGLGREGIEATRYLVNLGAVVVVLDANPAKKLVNYKEAKKLGASFQLGPDYVKGWDQFDMIVRSPGVSLDMVELKKAKRKGVEITSTTKIFFEDCPARIIGITGSKGKSTTTSLIHHLINERGRKVWLGGNIGVSLLPVIDKIKPKDWVVMELSSFQLEDMDDSPHVAVFLDVVPEHLDRHKTFAKYLAAKQNIYSHQKKSDWLITSIDFDAGRKATRNAKGKVFGYSNKHVLRRGLYVDKGEVIYRDLRTGKREVIIDIDGIKLPGRHNLQNVLPAMAASILAGVSTKKMVNRLGKFKTLSHRLEIVHKKDGVRFVDDSLATTPEATLAAVEAFAGTPTSLIVGGIDKGGDWVSTAKTIGAENVEYVAIIGQSSKKIKTLLKKYAPRVETEIHPTFKGAIKFAYKAVKNGGVVLLSPGCSSFDMFKDAYSRGTMFGEIVKKM
ncbi:MAG: UDP-N-acetylmuramoyl-L-alanine--D-glutamate ligase [Patescibacteria group bacterium]